MQIHSIFSIFIITLFAGACKNPGDDQSLEGMLTGRVTDTAGEPLPGAAVVASNTMIYNSSATGASDQNGNFRIQLPKVGTFVASATVKKNYNGKQYELDLHPDQTEPFSIDGTQVNFEWRLSGRKPIENEGFYGATLVINKGALSQIYDSENIEFTLVPVGPLIDGSTGNVLKRTPGQPHTPIRDQIIDVPLGRYRLTAVYKGVGNAAELKLRRHFSDDPFVPELIVDFEPDNIWGKNSAFIAYQE